MIVYADVIFFINFAFDIEMLLIILKLSSRKIPLLRLLLSACLGGLQGVFVFIPYFRILCTPPARLIIPFAMVAAVLCPCKIRECLKGWLLFLASAFIFSGAMSFLHIKTVWGLLLLVPVYILIAYAKRTAVRKKLKTELFYGGKSVEADGFFDSGNMIMYKNAPVILASEKIFRQLLGDGFSIYAVTEWADSRDVCTVPYSSLGKTGVLIGIRLDKAIVKGKIYENIVLGYFSDNFSDDLILNGIMT